MRASEVYLKTLKETPSEAEITSHRLMLRAGMIRKLGSGLYTWLPMGLRVLRKVEQIVREEMNHIGAMELLMPTVQPAELWQETGRWQAYGDQLLTMTDSNERAYCFGPTHEEVITDLLRQEVQSYKELPLTLYQIQTKFRDEIRPRFGVMRAREFIMKDAYSFHLEPESLQNTYDTMYATYCRVFERMGLQYRAVEADTGAIGGAVSHEFQVLADAGEDLLFYSTDSDYAANVEQATCLAPKPAPAQDTSTPQLVDTPGQKTIADVASYLQVDPSQMVKTLIVAGTKHPLVALVLRGNDKLNPIKAAKHPWIESPLCMVDETAVQQALNVPFGSIGPISLPIPIVVDHHAAALPEFACGANQKDKHYQHATWPNDHEQLQTADLRTVQNGDPSPDGQGSLQSCRGIEVGHIFQVGDKYSKAMHAVVTDESGNQQTLRMGCYGLGISRIVAAAIEQHHDESGILWPKALAPFQLVIIPINQARCPEVKAKAEELHQQCQTLGIDVLLDDRAERPGVLFADADLIGIPHRLVISDRLLAEKSIEYKARNQSNAEKWTLNALEKWLHTTFVKIDHA
ncbi:MAG: proline--tRNA ligase [Gammaproteobacteria bacterium]|nr:proline--tRNA ligase [Gammaproteobacteria bacterium]